MISSMTGYGRADKTKDGYRVTVEISTVNNRFLEFQIRLPKTLAELEQKIKALLSSKLHRGKVNFSLTIDNDYPDTSKLSLSNDYADMYYKILKELKERFHLPDEINLNHFVNLPDLITAEVSEVDIKRIWDLVQSVCIEALDKLCSMRQAEGQSLFVDFIKRLDLLADTVIRIKNRAVNNVEIYHEKLRQRIKELLEDIPVDDQRIAMETAMVAEKMDITEETTRLEAHMESFRQTLKRDDAIGKRLTFVLQEMHREANTISAKAADHIISTLTINIKEELEKLREQVQNIE
ncbi:MAG: YicC family protein [candidate division Zixibacteria bacterium 4484_95]|nr:MAG: YicC family protein [candidate division Zixibacteria bacterium 4484_95]